MPPITLFKPYVNDKAIELVTKTLKSGWVGEGPMVKEFETRLAQLVDSRFPVTVNSGTSALHLAALLAGIQPGDDVITTAQTMLASSEAILMAGANPVYADIEHGTGNIDASDVEKRITEKTRAILAVDWGGYPCDYDALIKIANTHNLVLIEDAAHALGATYKGRRVGSLCPYTTFSFQAIKHLTTGDGGMVCVPDEDSYKKAIRLRWFGIDRFQRVPSVLGEPIWNVTELGYKYHMNDIAAAIGLGNLDDFDFLLGRRREIVGKYRTALLDVAGVRLFDRADDRESADWLFSIHVDRREDFCRMMASKEIAASVVHLRIDRNDLCGGERTDLPELTRFTESHVSLPLHPYLTDDDIEHVIQAVKQGW